MSKIEEEMRVQTDREFEQNEMENLKKIQCANVQHKSSRR